MLPQLLASLRYLKVTVNKLNILKKMCYPLSLDNTSFYYAMIFSISANTPSCSLSFVTT